MYWIDYIFYNDDGLAVQTSAIISTAKTENEAKEKVKRFQFGKITILSCVRM